MTFYLITVRWDLTVNAKLSQLITKSTRITPNSATLLDLSTANKSVSVLDSDVIPCPLAYQELITFTVNLRKPKRLPIVKLSEV